MDDGDDWRLIREEVRPGPANMALDDVAARTVGDGGPRTVRVFAWEPSTLSMGYGQADDTVDWGFCDRQGIDVVRRPTGGGGIYHDTRGDISYSIVVPADEVPGDLLESYHRLLEPVLDALERMGVDARIAERERPALYEPACYLRSIDPAHDVVADGRKISGNAQHRSRDAVVQHGSLTYARETERHLGVFDEPGVTAEEYEDRVTSIREQSGIDRAAAVTALETALREWVGADEGEWTEAELVAARSRADERYAMRHRTRQR